VIPIVLSATPPTLVDALRTICAKLLIVEGPTLGSIGVRSLVVGPTGTKLGTWPVIPILLSATPPALVDALITIRARLPIVEGPTSGSIGVRSPVVGPTGTLGMDSS
jgi:hypothetical protein